MTRRMSTSFLQSLLIKQHNEKDDGDSQKSGGSSDRGSVGSSIGDLLTGTGLGSSQLQLLQPNRDQTRALLQLVYYMQTLVVGARSCIHPGWLSSDGVVGSDSVQCGHMAAVLEAAW